MSLVALVSEGPVLAFRPELVDVCGGDTIVGLLLGQIYYWDSPTKKGASKMQVKRDGQYWIAKTQEVWSQECRLSRKQYLRAIAVLKKLGLIETKLYKFAGITMTHLRLVRESLEAKLSALKCKLEDTQCTQTAHSVIPKGNNPLSPLGTLLSTENTEENTKRLRGKKLTFLETSEKDKSNSKDGPDKEIETEEEVVTECTSKDAEIYPGVNWFMKAADVVKSISEHKKKQTLAAVWRRYDFGGYHKPLTMKELGQFKQLDKKIGMTPVILKWVMSNWTKFALEASVQNGLKNGPSQPHVGFLLLYAGTAMNMFLHSSATASNKPSTMMLNKPKTEVNLKEVAKPVHKVHVATPEEIAELMESLK